MDYFDPRGWPVPSPTQPRLTCTNEGGYCTGDSPPPGSNAILPEVQIFPYVHSGQTSQSVQSPIPPSTPESEIPKRRRSKSRFSLLRLANRGRFGDLVAQTSDRLHYIDDIFALGVTEPTNVPCLVLLLRLFLPIYLHSLTRRHPPKDPSHANSLFHVIAMFLLALVFTILHQPELIRILTEAILIDDLTLLLPASKDDTSVDPPLILSQPRILSMSSPSFVLHTTTFLQTISTACGVFDPGKLSSSSLNEDIARRSKSIEDFQAGIEQSYDEKLGSNQPSGLSPSPSSSECSELTSQIVLPPVGLSPLTPRLQRGSSTIIILKSLSSSFKEDRWMEPAKWIKIE
ncbi:hypothetical protein Aperf_G00000003351 [Anoplocephala perfoliata]